MNTTSNIPNEVLVIGNQIVKYSIFYNENDINLAIATFNDKFKEFAISYNLDFADTMKYREYFSEKIQTRWNLYRGILKTHRSCNSHYDNEFAEYVVKQKFIFGQHPTRSI